MLNFIWTYSDMCKFITDVVLIGILIILGVVVGIATILERIKNGK